MAKKQNSNQHNINISDKKLLNKYVYRIFSFEKFLDIFARNPCQLTLVKPKLWEDPYENFLLKSYIKNTNGEQIPFGSIKESLFAQCWAFNRESDFMWRVFAPNKDGIKVKVKLKNLVDFVGKHGNAGRDDKCYIGKVDYRPWQEIKSQYESISFLELIRKEPNSMHFINTLLIKRKEFSAEREVRIIYKCNTFANDKTDFIQISINPNELFENIVIDPRISKTRAQNTIVKLIEKVGYKGKIDHSGLYSFAPLAIDLKKN